MGRTRTALMRSSSQRAKIASKIPRTMQTSHAGKNDPTISKEGARLQPDRSPVEQEITERTQNFGCSQLEVLTGMGSSLESVRVGAARLRPLKSLCFLCLLLFTSSSWLVGLNLQFGTPVRPETRAPVCARGRRLSVPAPACVGRQLHPASCEHHG